MGRVETKSQKHKNQKSNRYKLHDLQAFFCINMICDICGLKVNTCERHVRHDCLTISIAVFAIATIGVHCVSWLHCDAIQKHSKVVYIQNRYSYMQMYMKKGTMTSYKHIRHVSLIKYNIDFPTHHEVPTAKWRKTHSCHMVQAHTNYNDGVYKESAQSQSIQTNISFVLSFSLSLYLSLPISVSRSLSLSLYLSLSISLYAYVQ